MFIHGARYADTGGVTTFDESDLFDLVDDDDGDEETPGPRHGRRVAVVLVVAAALVAAGVAWLLSTRQDAGAQAASMTVELLAAPQQPTDEIDPTVAEDVRVDPTTTRFAVRTDEGDHYAALRWGGELCLVVVPDGDVARAACVAAQPRASTTLTGADGSRVRLAADDAASPRASDDWQAEGPNVWVAGAPAD